jgi:hypothetical protein
VNRGALPHFITHTNQIVVGEDVNFDKLAEDLAAMVGQGDARDRVVEDENLYSPSIQLDE